MHPEEIVIFARMSTDVDYLADSSVLERDFDQTNWEAFQRADIRSRYGKPLWNSR